MPGLVTMKPVLKSRGSASKALSRAKEERGLGALLSQIRVSPAKKGRWSVDPEALGVLTRSNLAMKLRMKLLGEGAEGETVNEEVDTSGGKHEPSSVCLAAMVDEFLEDDDFEGSRGRCRLSFDDEPRNNDDDSRSSLVDELIAVLHSSADNIPERIVFCEVSNFISITKPGLNSGDGVMSSLKRQVMRYLRRAGYNAGLCKSRWDHSGGFPGGDYEYIDVVFESPTGRFERILIDIDLRAQFEIARPTAQYDSLVQALPSIFVGRAEQLHWIVNVMSDAVKLSLKKRGMHLPPWRRPEYMRAKWFSSYNRTTSDIWDKPTESELPHGSVASASGYGCLNTDLVARVAEFPRPVEKPVGEVTNTTENRFDAGGETQKTAGSVNNNDWNPPVLKAKKLQAPGLASMFREGSLSASMKNMRASERKDLVMVA